tara:strand:- start:346 stop:1155 length:810 start_codon:yes stop_codon:yes gene_type:complete
MKRYLVKKINKFLLKLGFILIRKKEESKVKSEFNLHKIMSYALLEKKTDKLATFSKSQYGQDWFAEALIGQKIAEGFFVEFGAINGIQNSNSYYFEKVLKWNGIVAEPAKKWHKELYQNRNCIIEKRCIYNSSGKMLEFIETGKWPGGNTLSFHKDDDGTKRKISDSYLVETILLNDMLEFHGAPKYIDFISIDTEGSEFEILDNFDFDKTKFGLILVEHNHIDSKKNSIRSLLEKNGYKHLNMSEEISKVDDWFASIELYKRYKKIFL